MPVCKKCQACARCHGLGFDLCGPYRLCPGCGGAPTDIDKAMRASGVRFDPCPGADLSNMDREARGRS